MNCLLQMLQEIAKVSPKIEFVPDEDPDSFTNEKKAAIEELSDLSKVFPDNNKFDEEELPSNSDDSPLVAIKKSKINAFNSRDGVLFYALREVQVLQKMASSDHVCKLVDVFYTDNNSIGIVTEYFDNSLDKMLQSNMPK